MRQLKISQKITNRETPALEQYLNDLNKIPMITPDEEYELGRKARQGDEYAIERLTSANLRFVVSVAKQYQNQGLTLLDLINEGNLGLMKAARRFDETRGFKFISYAVWWIRQSILHAITEYSRIVRMPVNKVSSYNKVNDAIGTYMQEFHREPSPEEIAGLLGVTVKEVQNMLRTNVHHTSVDAPISGGEDSEMTMLDMMQDSDDLPDERLDYESLRTELTHSLAVLSPREREVVTAIFGLNGNAPMKREEVAETLNLTRERVRQICERALYRLRRAENGETLRSYL